MKKYFVLLLCMLSLGTMAQTKHKAVTAQTNRKIVSPAQHLHFQGISLNVSFRNLLKYLRAKYFDVDVRDESDYCDISGTVCGIPNFDITPVGDWSDEGKIYGVIASKSFSNVESMNQALDIVVDKLTKAYPRYEDGFVTLVDESRNMIDFWSVDVLNEKGTNIGSLYVFAQEPDGDGDCKITIHYLDYLNSLASDARYYKVFAYDIPIDITKFVKPTLDDCQMEVANAFLKFTCRKGNNVYEMAAIGNDRDEILSCLYGGSTPADIQQQVMNAYFAKSLRVYNGNVMACTSEAFDGINDQVMQARFKAQKAQEYVSPTDGFIEFNEKILNSKTNADMGWTLLEYFAKRKASSSGSSSRQKYHCNGLEFDNPADMENYKNAQGLK